MEDRIKVLLKELRNILDSKELSRLDIPEGARGFMNPDFINGLFVNPPASKYHKAKIDIDIVSLLTYLMHDKVQQHLVENVGKLRMTVKQAKPKPNTPERWYGALDSNDWKKKTELTSKEHSPDRAVTSNASAEDDLPF